MNDLPPDVHAVLAQLLREAQVAVGQRDHEAALAAVGTIDEVASNKLPAGERRRRLRHGCERVEQLLAGGGPDDVAAAGSYLAAMQRRVG